MAFFRLVGWTLTLAAACAGVGMIMRAQGASVADTARLQQMAARFAPTEIGADVSALSPSDRQVLAKLIAASKIIDALFLRQVWAGNDAMLLDLASNTTADGRARLHYFLVNKGPWSRLDHDQPFVAGAPPKPAGANFYPGDATKAELERWMESLPEAERARARGFFTVVRRGAGRCVHARSLQPRVSERADSGGGAAPRGGSAHLRAVAEGLSQPSARTRSCPTTTTTATSPGWSSRARSSRPSGRTRSTRTSGSITRPRSNRSSPSSTGRRATSCSDSAASCRTSRTICRSIRRYRNPKLGSLAPIVVVNEIFAAGDANRGVQTAAFNLPNDERVTRDKGAKRVMLKNVQDAKFAKTLVPISRVVLSPADQKDLSFEAFFTHILVHELMHGLGPHNITVNGRQTTVRQEMKEASSALEEAKADISSLFAIQYLIDKGVLPAALERPLYTTFLASAFRSIRFGINEAHGRGIAIQLNYLLDQGGFEVRGDGTFAREPGQDQGRRDRAHARDHDDAGARRLRRRPRRWPSGSASCGRRFRGRSTS